METFFVTKVSGKKILLPPCF